MKISKSKRVLFSHNLVLDAESKSDKNLDPFLFGRVLFDIYNAFFYLLVATQIVQYCLQHYLLILDSTKRENQITEELF